MALRSESASVVFIGGTGRSGTSITRQILDRHPAVGSLPFEYRFIIDPDGIVDFYCSYPAAWSPFMADKRIARLEQLLETLSRERTVDRLLARVLRHFPGNPRVLSPRQYQGWELEKHLPGYRRHVARLIDRLYDFSYAAYWVGTESYTRQAHIRHAAPIEQSELRKLLGEFIEDVVSDYLEAHGKDVFVEDNTWNILFAKELFELVPNGKLVHVKRDPRDVLSSFLGQRWCPDDVYEACLYYRSLMDRWAEINRDLPSQQVHEFSLEMLVTNPQNTVGVLCDFIGIPFQGTMLRQDLTKSNSGRWRQDLTQDEQKIVRQQLGEYVTALGYAK